VSSARKLRFYDAADLSEVIAGHLEEKQALAEENARLLIELEAVVPGGPQGVKARLDAGGESAVSAAAERARRTEDGVNRVMLIAMRGELQRVRDALEEAQRLADDAAAAAAAAAVGGAVGNAAGGSISGGGGGGGGSDGGGSGGSGGSGDDPSGLPTSIPPSSLSSSSTAFDLTSDLEAATVAAAAAESRAAALSTQLQEARVELQELGRLRAAVMATGVINAKLAGPYASMLILSA